MIESPDSKPTLMIVGMGDLGGVLLDYLIRIPELGKIVAADIDLEKCQARCNLSRLTAGALGCDPHLESIAIDLNEAETVAEAVARTNPSIILSTATMQTWWLPDLLPETDSRRIRAAGFGVWLPVHMTLSMSLMQALQEIAYQGSVLLAPFPDVVNCVLGRIGLEPSCGIGNVDEVVPKVQILAARKLNKVPGAVQVFLVAHHAIQRFTLGRHAISISDLEAAPPVYLRIECEGKDVTAELGGMKLLFSAFPISPGRASHYLTAATTCRLVSALCRDGETLVHAPGPRGLPGGYPLLVSRHGLRLAPLPELSEEEAIGINERSHRFDGIERIESDGTIVFVARSAEIMKEVIGYDCPRLVPQESADRAQELIARFRDHAKRLGVQLPG
jgi:hypothetical protein